MSAWGVGSFVEGESRLDPKDVKNESNLSLRTLLGRGFARGRRA